MPEVLRIAEKRLSSETVAYRCEEVNYEKYRLDASESGRRIADTGKKRDHALYESYRLDASELARRIADTGKKGDHALYCRPREIAVDGEKRTILDGDKGRIVFVSKYGVFQY